MSNHDVLSLIQAEARRLHVGRSLPPEGELDWPTIRAIGDDLQQLHAAPSVTWNGLAAGLGHIVTGETLRRFAGAQSREDLPAQASASSLARRLNTQLELLARRNESTLPEDFVETRAAQMMLAIIRKCNEWGSMGLITSDSGRGKSLTLRAASEIMPGSMLIRCSTDTTRPQLLRAICNVAGAKPSQRTFVMEERLEQLLSGTGRLLMLDEAHKLRPHSLDVVRDVHDLTGCPIVLAGTSGVLRTVFNSDDGGQFASRVAVRLDLESYLAGGEGGDGGPLHTTAEIVKLFYSDRVKLSSDGAQALARISNVPGLGGLRLAKQVFRAAVDAAVADGRESIDAQLVRATLKSLQGVDMVRRVEAGFAAQHRRKAAVA